MTLLSLGVTQTRFVKRANMDKAANVEGKLNANTLALAGYNAMMAAIVMREKS